MRRDVELFLWAVVWTLVGITLALAFAHQWHAQDECHERGGIIEHFHGGWRCAKPRSP